MTNGSPHTVVRLGGSTEPPFTPTRRVMSPRTVPAVHSRAMVLHRAFACCVRSRSVAEMVFATSSFSRASRASPVSDNVRCFRRGDPDPGPRWGKAALLGEVARPVPALAPPACSTDSETNGNGVAWTVKSRPHLAQPSPWSPHPAQLCQRSKRSSQTGGHNATPLYRVEVSCRRSCPSVHRQARDGGWQRSWHVV